MKIVIAGDFCPRYRTEELLNKANGSISIVDDDLISIIKSSSYSIINLECPIISSLNNCTPIRKCGPNLNATENSLLFVKSIGFKGVTLANNHILDYGEQGVFNTIQSCNKLGVDYVGVGANLLDSQIVLYKKLNNKTVAFINSCEQEFSIAGVDTAGANPLNPISLYYSISEAKAKADYVIVIIHGGHEHYQLPSPRMQDYYRYFIDCGADVIVNHHQHCYSGYELYKGKPIFYGLGNFCFDDNKKRSGMWTEGCMLELTIENKMTYKLIPYVQCGKKPIVRQMNDFETIQFEKNVNNLNEVIKDRQLLLERHQQWMKSTEIDYLLALSPYSNRYLKAAAHRSLLPMGLTVKKMLLLTNYVLCESHRDRLIATLTNYIKMHIK